MYDELTGYYERRAAEYDRVYEKPERQADLEAIGQFLRGAFQDRTVLEVAAGTGYWTVLMAAKAARILATDINASPLRIARTRNYGTTPVEITLADAFTLRGVPDGFDAAFMGFWWSHMRRELVAQFLDSLVRHLRPGAKVVAIDNRFVQGSSTAISRVDDQGNSFQSRELQDGTRWEVLKNFPTALELSRAVASIAATARVTELTYYWILEFTVRP